MGHLLNFKETTLKRIAKIAAASAAALLVLILFSIISFNKLWIQSMPQGNLILLAELELARLKIPACKTLMILRSAQNRGSKAIADGGAFPEKKENTAGI